MMPLLSAIAVSSKYRMSLQTAKVLLKLCLTAGVFYLLLTHEVTSEGKHVRIIDALSDQMMIVDWQQLMPWLLLGTSIKMLGIGCSMLRWDLLLQGQGIYFGKYHIVSTFLIGRFLGTFLPSTVGLDSYKLYDAIKFSKRAAEPTTATIVEKIMGLMGMFLTFIVSFPFGYTILGPMWFNLFIITVPFIFIVIMVGFFLIIRPEFFSPILSKIKYIKNDKVRVNILRIEQAMCAYRGKSGLIFKVMMLSFMVHLFTAIMYYFTTRAVGIEQAPFGIIVFASSIQIVATVFSPFTIAGEGVREVVQTLLLAKHIGIGGSVLSAALGFWAAESITLIGAVFWWMRKDDYVAPIKLSSV